MSIFTLENLLAGFIGWAAHPIDELPKDWHLLIDPMDPIASSQLVDVAFRDVPAGFVTDTCIMESSCYASRPISIHAGDIAASLPAYGRAVRSGRLAPDRCAAHAARGEVPGHWSTRGAHGLMAAYQVFRLGTCLPPEVLDVPLLSALAAGRKARFHCRSLERRGKSCTRLRLRCAWAMAPLGTRACGRVIHRWKKRLKKYKSIRTGIDWDHPPSVAELRQRQRIPRGSTT